MRSSTAQEPDPFEDAVWYVAAFSLELDDEDEILEAAHKFAKGLVESFGVSSND